MKNLTYNKLLRMINENKIYPDCYVVDKNFEWTFVFTHETLEDCSASGFANPCYIGPFFTTINDTLKN